MNKITVLLLTCLYFTCFTGAANAAENTKIVSPDSIPGSTIVDAEGVIELITNNPALNVIDARIKSDRKQGYIEGSVRLPDISTDCPALAKVIPAKTAPALFYCNGIKCGRSAKSVQIALNCGYNNVYWFRGGFEEWQTKGFPVLND